MDRELMTIGIGPDNAEVRIYRYSDGTAVAEYRLEHYGTWRNYYSGYGEAIDCNRREFKFN